MAAGPWCILVLRCAFPCSRCRPPLLWLLCKPQCDRGCTVQDPQPPPHASASAWPLVQSLGGAGADADAHLQEAAGLVAQLEGNSENLPAPLRGKLAAVQAHLAGRG